MPCSSAKALTSRRKRLPIFCSNAGEGIGKPRCSVKKVTTWPPTCSVGTYAFRYNRSMQPRSRSTWPSSTSLMFTTLVIAIA